MPIDTKDFQELEENLMQFLASETRRVANAEPKDGSQMHVGDLADMDEAMEYAKRFLAAAQEFLTRINRPVRCVIGPCFSPAEGWGVLVRVERLPDQLEG
ncbi:MAG: hypothetical protein V3T86_17245 [Planctomycetota bacterium]